ncbi:MAG: hypothetical protein GTO18_00440 [Anaerolineales bacterium]|nr:hypothetical protein [Anaerolineales bacterium]
MSFAILGLAACRTDVIESPSSVVTETNKAHVMTRSVVPVTGSPDTPTTEDATKSPDATATDPWSPMKTAVAQGTRLDSIDEVLPTPYPFATPTLESGHSYWVIDKREERPRNNILVVFQYESHQWNEFSKEEGYAMDILLDRGTGLSHDELDGCVISGNFLSPPWWSSVEEENFMPWEPYPRVRTYFGNDGEWLFRIIRVGPSDVRITYPSDFQDDCHREAMRVINTHVISHIDGTPEP